MKKRGEVWWIKFDPSVGSEIQKTRPAVIVSSNDSNKLISRFQVIPLTRTVKSDEELLERRGEVTVLFNKAKNTAKINQVSTVSIERFKNKAGSLGAEAMSAIDAELKIQLGLIRKRITAKKKDDDK